MLGLCLLVWGAREATSQQATSSPANLCGPANDLLTLQPPTNGLCASGNPSQVNGSGPWSWTCATPGSGPPPPVYCVAPTTIGNAPIPNSRFDRYVKFHGDEGNHGWLATQARVNAVVTTTEQPFFMAGFFRAEDHPTWGMLAAVQSDDRNNGTFALSLAAYGMGASLFEWRSGPFYGLATAPNILRGPYKGGTPVAYVLNQWHFIAAAIKDHCNSQIFLEGVWNDPTPVCVPWPTGLSSTTFGSYYEFSKGAGDAHVYNGGLRDWAIVTGVPTAEELLRMRSGEDPRKVWGASRVWGYWNFTTDPASGAKEPDLTGHGHDLTYSGGGSVDRKKPTLIIRGSPRPAGQTP